MLGKRYIVLFLVLGTFLLVQYTEAQSWFDVVRPHPIVDRNPDPDIVEVILVASRDTVRYKKGPETQVMTYNGSIPGPTINGKVGDTLIVHFFNELNEDTTIHWHGLELPANMDGSNISQLPVPPSGYFRYEFQLQRAATFWYHPHIETAQQVEKGLYGALVVRDPEEDAALDLPKREHILVLDDVLLNNNNQLAPFIPLDAPRQNASMQHNGREGNYLLVNGRINPHAYIRKNVPHRMRLINTSNSRFMRVSVPAPHKLWRIGGDGGLLEAPLEVEPIGMVRDHHGERSDPDRGKGILLTPAERADVVLVPGGEARVIELEWHDIPRGRATAFLDNNGNIVLGHSHLDGTAPLQALITFHLYGQGTSDYEPPPELRDIVEIDTTGAETKGFIFGHTLPDANGNLNFFAQAPGKPFPAVTPDDAHDLVVGRTYIWEVTNLTGGDHNFHTHGFHFQPIETEFVDATNLANNFVVPWPYTEWKDTVFVPKRPGPVVGLSKTIVRLAVTIDDAGREGQTEAFGKVPGKDTSGGWLAHCHILEHSNRGMMSFFEVFNDPPGR